MNFNHLFRKKSVSQILKSLDSNTNAHESLSKQLKVRDLTSFGIAAIIGAGIFSTIGKASADGGPAVVFLFIFTAIACGFAAFAYAEFASMVPVSGSAYTYSYVAFGELFAWIIGWALIMEYAVGNIVVAISWSDYFVSLLKIIKIPALGIHGINVPEWATMDYFTARNGYQEALNLINQGAELTADMRAKYNAWSLAPTIGNFHIIVDIPALAIIVLITALVYRGIKETRNASNIMVVIKLCVVLLVIVVGAFYVDVSNWHPFAPNGISGVLKGVSAVFFAYIGFDAISTTAEECKNPQRDLPRGMMYAIIICTVLYILIALVLTGMVSYKELNVGDPLAFVFEKLHLNKLSGLIAVSAVVAMSSVILVFQMGQPRIWMSMSKDGLLPKKFSHIHPKFKTPGYSTIITGFVVAIPVFFMDLSTVADICSIGTLFAFTLVCAGVIKLQSDPNAPERKFKTPYFNSKYIMPALLLLTIVLMLIFNKAGFSNFFKIQQLKEKTEILSVLDENDHYEFLKAVTQEQVLNPEWFKNPNITQTILEHFDNDEIQHYFEKSNIEKGKYMISGWTVFKHQIPYWVFIIISCWVTVQCFKKSYSLIPVLGALSCLYMMSELGIANWIGFTIWLIVGLIIYFGYSMKNSKLNTQSNS
ncbi:MAG: amino acid permease [Bacteroidia bacterium]|nr:amino acid permease [Bacteroidia bacterium]MCZ2248183.1 amino acid permease [Bacteroidia bacterium]